MCLHLGGFSKGEEKYIFGKMQFIGALIKLSFDIQVVGGDAKPRRPPVWHPRQPEFLRYSDNLMPPLIGPAKV